MFRHTRATTVVSQPARFSTPPVSARLEPQPGLLDGVVGLAERAEHPVGDRAQAGPVLLEPLGQPVRSSIGHVPLRRRGHSSRPAKPADVTDVDGDDHDLTHSRHRRHRHARPPRRAAAARRRARRSGCSAGTAATPADGVEYVIGDLATGDGRRGRGGRRRAPSCTARAAPRATTDRPATWSGRRPRAGVAHLVNISVVGADRVPVASADRPRHVRLLRGQAAPRSRSSPTPGCRGRRCAPTQFHDLC